MRVKIQNSFDHLSHYVTSFEQIKSNISLILSIIKFLSCYSHNFCYKAISTSSFFYNPCNFCSLIDLKRLLDKLCWKFSLLTIFSIIVLLTFPKVITRIIFFNNQDLLYSWWLLPFFPWPKCVIQRWYRKEKIETNHS